jgi:hypothetical protein
LYGFAVVTPEHEALHRIFQKDPELFARAMEKILGVPVPVPDEVTILNTDLTETRPVERRVDSVLLAEILVQTGADRYIVVIEYQTDESEERRRRWPYAIAFLHDKYDCPVIVLVVCSKPGTARWAREPIRIGPPDVICMTVQVVVFGPDNVPAVTDPAEAAEDVCFAVFSALTHSRSGAVGGILGALALALGTVDAETGAILAEFTETGLGRTAGRTIWRKLMATASYPYVSQLRAQGRLEAKREAILQILECRGIAVSDAVRDAINACKDKKVLDRWLRRAVTIHDGSELLVPAKAPRRRLDATAS